MHDATDDEGTSGQAPTQEERIRVLTFMNAEIDRRHDREEGARSTVEGKLTAIVGFLLVAIPLVLKYQRGAWAVASVVAFGVSIAFALSSLWPRKWVGVPKPQRLVEIYTTTQTQSSLEERMLARVVATKNAGYEENARRYRGKLRFASLCHLFLAVGFLLTLIAILVSDIGRN